ncbi:MAG: hypothetical protein ACE5K1_09070 [Acidiferrobacterales bacterium]
MFDTEQFIEQCRAALKENNAHAAVHEVVTRAVAQPARVLAAVGEPKLAGIETLYRSDELTILNVLWGPCMFMHPHDHRMWAVIGIYAGREDNTFYRRRESGLTEHGAKALNTKDTIALGETIIHAVTNPLEQITAAIHVYGGDFFATPRSEWDPQSFEEHPYDVEHTKRLFEESNKRLR